MSSSFSLRRTAFAPASSSATASRSDAEDSCERGGPRAVGADFDESDPGEGNARSDAVTAESGSNSRPVGSILSRTGVEEADDGAFRSPGAMWLTAVCSTATTSGGQVEDFDLEGGGDADKSGVDTSIVPGRASMSSSITRVVTGFGDVEGTRRLAGFVRAGDTLLSSGGTSVMLSSTRSGT